MYARTVLVIAAALIAGCGSLREHRGIASQDPAEKIPAIKKAGAAKDRKAVPDLVKELNHDDPAVRLYAIQALERITGETLNYRFYEDEDQRKPAIARWNEWLAKHRH
jgi:hypothetical protein